MTDYTVYPGGGGDYISLQAWENAMDGNALDTKRALVDNSGNAGTCSINGWVNTPDASNQVTIINEAAGDLHDLTQSSFSSSARVEVTTGRCILVSEPYVTVDGMFLKKTSTTDDIIEFDNDPWTLKNTYLWWDDGGTNAKTMDVDAAGGTVENVISFQYTNTTSIANHVDVAFNTTIKNSVFWSKQNTAVIQRGIRCSANTATIYSTYVGGSNDTNDNYEDTGGTFAGDYNAQDDAGSHMPGGNSLNSKAGSDQFTDPDNGDFTLKATADLIDAGDPSNSTATDWEGVTRSNPDIGAQEYVAAVTGGSNLTLLGVG